MTVELVLALLVNLLHTRAPDAPPPALGATAAALGDITTLRDLLTVLEAEHGLDLIVYMLQQIDESDSFRAWNLNLLELLYYILSSHAPAVIYGPDAQNGPGSGNSVGTENSAGTGNSAGASNSVGANGRPAAAGAATPGVRGGSGGADASTTAHPRRAARPGALGSLLEQRQEERRRQQLSLDTRHGNFGGAFRVKSQFGDTEHILGHQGYEGGGALPVSARGGGDTGRGYRAGGEIPGVGVGGGRYRGRGGIGGSGLLRGGLRVSWGGGCGKGENQHTSKTRPPIASVHTLTPTPPHPTSPLLPLCFRLQAPARRRKPKNRLPLAADVPPRSDPNSVPQPLPPSVPPA